MIDAELRLFLMTFPGVTDLVGTRVYPALLPEDETLPAVVLQQISEVPSHSNSGVSHTRPRYQIDCYASTLATARVLDQHIRKALRGQRNRMGGYTTVSFLRNTSNYKLNDEESWRVSSDYVIHLVG